MQLHPVLNEGTFCFLSLPTGSSIPPEALLTFHEQEGPTIILETSLVKKYGYIYIENHAFARITLSAQTDLNAVGITATVSQVLAEHNISCNLVAAYHHDHLFVPTDKKEQALALLKEITI